MNWTEFWHMGGYGFYVWTAWGLTMTTLLALIATAKIRRRKLLTELTIKAQRAAIQAENQHDT